jgi:hypothetical protein
MKEKRFFKPDKLKTFLFGMTGMIGFSIVILLLWNLLMPDIFGLKVISFWQAAGLLILSRVLFSPFLGGGRHHHDRHMEGFRDNPIHEKWMKMSEEERQEFINKRREFFHDGPFDRRDFFGRRPERPDQHEEPKNDKQ